MKTPSKWSPIGHSHTLPTDEPTHRRVMLAARARMVEAGEDGDIRAAMAEYVREAVERMEEGRAASGRLQDLVARLEAATPPSKPHTISPDVLRAMAESEREENEPPAFADGTAPGTAKVSPDGGEWMWRDRGPTR